MKLYLAEISLTVVVAAENEKAAYDLTSAELYDIVRNERTDTYDIEVGEVTTVPPGWADALPYGENPDELTCDQILENNQ
jgi:hypothetical protein